MEKERDDAIRQIQIKHQREKLDLSQKKETIKKQLEENEINHQQNLNFSRILLDQGELSCSKEEDSKLLGDIRNRKSLEMKFKSEIDLQENQKKTLERQKMLEEREKLRKEHINEKQKEMKSFSNKYKEEQRKKVQLSNSQLEIKIMSQRNEIERKEKLSENKRKYFDQLKSMAVKREKDFNKVKSDEMLRALEKKKQQEYIKMVQYVEKHEKINSQKKSYGFT